MTLHRQIHLLLNFSFLAVLLLVFSIELQTTRDALSQQMETDVQNGSTALGLTLAPYLEEGSRAGIDTVLQSYFDGGFYRRISLEWFDREELLDKHYSGQIRGVPDWFRALPLFEPVVQEQVLTSGWYQVARLRLESNPAVAYQALWRTLLHLIWTLGLLYLALLLVINRGLKFLMRPLDDIAQQAERISERHFDQPLEQPRTEELQKVVTAINRMSDRIERMLTDQDQQIQQLRRRTQTDAVSGLANRSHLAAHLDAWLAEAGIGALMLIDMRWLTSLYKREGYQYRDKLIKDLAQLLGELHLGQPGLVARLSHSEFALLHTGVVADDWLEQVAQRLRAFSLEHHQDGDELALALVLRGREKKAGDMLAAADNALRQAWLSKERLHRFDAGQDSSLSQSDWRDTLAGAISQGAFSLLAQPALVLDGNEPLHQEWLAALVLDGQTLPAGRFLPLIEQFAMAADFDLAILKLLEGKGAFLEAEPQVVNLSLATVQSPQGLYLWLDTLPRDARLIFELSEDLVLADLPACLAFAEGVREQGCQLGLDHVGRNLKSMDYLRQLQPDHIKLDQSLACFDAGQGEQQEVAKALVRIARGLDITVIATRVETREQLAQLESLQVDGYQGYLAPPVAR
ncbi:EAL domain-containing protein [Gallaecimonas sp. GXIMD4217]|uniref:EAL domain-containing protein n=1 Tax=Gallaecimonas sp. GXIMD4217 TaxID=3131927 RepID=UPI00311B27F2